MPHDPILPNASGYKCVWMSTDCVAVSTSSTATGICSAVSETPSVGTCQRPLDFRDSVLMPCTGFYCSWASVFGLVHKSRVMDGHYVGGRCDATACDSCGSPPRGH